MIPSSLCRRRLGLVLGLRRRGWLRGGAAGAPWGEGVDAGGQEAGLAVKVRHGCPGQGVAASLPSLYPVPRSSRCPDGRLGDQPRKADLVVEDGEDSFDARQCRSGKGVTKGKQQQGPQEGE
jgi:hypothetical protein